MHSNGIAVIGAGMIGAAHANGYRTYLPRFTSTLPGLRLIHACDANREMAKNLAQTWGFEQVSTDWREVLADPDVGIISICLPNFLHAEVTEAALDAGKHVICEKPLALSGDDAKRVADKAKTVNCVSAIVANSRRIPAVTEAHNRIVAGDIGRPVHILIQFQSEYAADPLLPYSWRYERALAGAGALLDVGPHAIDTARFLCGEITGIVGAIETISVPERYLPKEAVTGHFHTALSDEKRIVDNDDVTSAVLKFENGCQGLFSASRVTTGLGNSLSFVLTGTAGTIRFTTERPGEYEIAQRSGSGMFERVINRASSPYAGLIPVPHDSVAVGYAEYFGFMIYEFLESVAEGRPMQNGSLEDGMRTLKVLDAIGQSARTGQPVHLV